MTVNVYAIKDVKIGFESPFIRVNDDVAIREFHSAAKFANNPNRFQECPADYELWRLGSYNQETGVITSDVQYVINLQGVIKYE